MATCAWCGKQLGWGETENIDGMKFCSKCADNVISERMGRELPEEVKKEREEAKRQEEEGLAKLESGTVSDDKEKLVFLRGNRGRSMTVYADRVMIKTTMSLGSLVTGNAADGEKTIFFADVIGVQHKPYGESLSIGYLQFETAAGTMNNLKSNFFNENTFTYDKDMEEKVVKVRDYAIALIAKFKQAAGPSPADELLKYKQCLDCGAITQAEFEAKKRELL